MTIASDKSVLQAAKVGDFREKSYQLKPGETLTFDLGGKMRKGCVPEGPPKKNVAGSFRQSKPLARIGGRYYHQT